MEENFFSAKNESVPAVQDYAIQKKDDVSPKSRIVAAILAYLFGTVGAHDFYLGKIKCGIAKALIYAVGLILIISSIYPAFSALFGGSRANFADFLLRFSAGLFLLSIVWVWAFVEFIMAICGILKDKDGLCVKNW